MIIFLYGADSFRSKRLLQEMKTKFINEVDAESNSLDIIDGASADLRAIDEKIHTGSLFARKRMVVIENIFQNKKAGLLAELEQRLKKVASEDDLIIILRDGELGAKSSALKNEAKQLFALLKQQKFVQEFKPLSGASLINFINDEATRYGKIIDASAASELATRTGSDLWLCAQGIKKAAFGFDSETINLEAIKEATAEIFNEDIFALTDAISNRNKRLALKILEEQYAAGLSDEYLLAMLARQFKIMIRINAAAAAGLSPASAATKLKLHPFVVKKSWTQSKNFNLEKLKGFLDKIIFLDKANKSSDSQTRAELALLLADL